MKLFCTATAILTLSFAADSSAELADTPTGLYELDKTHAYISFSYSHLGFSNPLLGFRSFDAALRFDSNSPENSEVTVSIDAASIDSRLEDFNEKLRSAELFDTDKHPKIEFVSTAIASTGAGTFDVTGDLTIKGVTRPVTLQARINKAANHPLRRVPAIGLSGTARVLRSDFGLTRSLAAVGDEVDIHIEAEFFRTGTE